MRRPEQPGDGRKARKRHVFCAGLLLVLTAAGCSNTSMDKVGDPLLGAAPPPSSPFAPPPPQSTQTTPPAGAPNTSSNVPPIPVPSGSPTNAALASQTRPLGDKSLAITEPNQGGAGWQRNAVTPTVPTSNAPQQARPKVFAVPRSDSFSAAAPPTVIQPAGNWSAGAAPTPQQLQEMLDARGVVGRKMLPHGNGVHLICAVRKRSNPNENLLYEVTAPDYASAVQAIIRQIDQQRPE